MTTWRVGVQRKVLARGTFQVQTGYAVKVFPERSMGRFNLQWLMADNDEGRALLGVLYNGNDGHFSHFMKWDARHLGMKEELKQPKN
ncbi:hypothetical protein EYC80_007734 [Monilinia laxa]|uniref:Uncharacterized protein n=1 Tax=Monilinia laxa TaxID=61186 RepID=A0A5N6JWU7_MONLA|nr:hypothetical protein EYC80_007734 [Monilinia laxa]